MATTAPAPRPSMHIPRTSRHHPHRHEASGEPRVRSILLTGSSTSAYARNEDQEAAPNRSSTSICNQRTTQRTDPCTKAHAGEGLVAAAHTGLTSNGSGPEAESISAEARPPPSSSSASIRLEEDLAAALASTPTPGRTTTLNSPELAMPQPHAARRHMSLELPAHEPLDMLYDADHKLSLEGASPKPCIVPGNALHLIDEDPHAPRSQTPPSVIIVPADEGEENASNATDGDAEEDGETSEGGRASSQRRPGAGPRVRFRSRVRITSGVHRHRHSTTNTNGIPTPCSSASDSPSSSISAPLRYQADEHGTWGPIGKRLSQYASAGGWPRRTQVPQAHRVQVEQNSGPLVVGRVRGGKGARSYNERTPLLRPGRQRSYTEETDDSETVEDQLSPEDRALRTAALRREEEQVFGRWPWRIFNRHWWWWHMEPVLCCCCADESDYEEF